MHEMQTVVTDVSGVCPSVCLSRGRLNSASLCGGHPVQTLPNHFGFLFNSVLCVDYTRSGSTWLRAEVGSRELWGGVHESCGRRHQGVQEVRPIGV